MTMEFSEILGAIVYFGLAAIVLTFIIYRDTEDPTEDPEWEGYDETTVEDPCQNHELTTKGGFPWCPVCEDYRGET